VLWRYLAELVAWMDAQPEEFATPLRHLLARAGVRRALGLP
jgi:hypothetical protein